MRSDPLVQSTERWCVSSFPFPFLFLFLFLVFDDRVQLYLEFGRGSAGSAPQVWHNSAPYHPSTTSILVARDGDDAIGLGARLRIMSFDPQDSSLESGRLQPPLGESVRTPTSPQPRDSMSASSIPSHNSDIYINSYYYGNTDMPDLAVGASTSAFPGWSHSRSASPINSPNLNSNDERLIRRLSWGSGADVPPAPDYHIHNHNHIPSSASFHNHHRSTSSADAGLIRGPLDLAFRDSPDVSLPERFPSRVSSLPHQYDPARASLSSIPMANNNYSTDTERANPGEESDRAILTAHQDGVRHASIRYHDDTVPTDFARSTDSPVQIEEAHPYFKSSADVYNTAGHHVTGPTLERARSGLHRFSKSVRRLSRRVVHLDSDQGHVALPDQDADDSDSSGTVHGEAPEDSTSKPPSLRLEELQLLRGKSLGIWGPESRLRKALAALLSQWWVEPFILLLIITNTVALIVQSGRSVFAQPRKQGYFQYIVDYVLLVVFAIYTVEIAARIIVSGLIINPPPLYAPQPLSSGASDDQETQSKQDASKPSEHRRQMSRSNTLDTLGLFGDSIKGKAQRAFAGDKESSVAETENSAMAASAAVADSDRNAKLHNVKRDGNGSDSLYPAAQILHPGRHVDRTETSMLLSESTMPSFWQNSKAPFVEAMKTQRAQAVHHAFLRHSWNRLDLVAVISFWIAFGLAFAHQEETQSHHIYIFRALSVLRCARLLTATSGTSTILESLKTAGPILVSVSFFTGFALLLFSIIGIQSFKGSYRRNCIWVGDLNGQPGTNHTLSQICGGYTDRTGRRIGHILTDGTPSGTSPKGYICPRGQLCQESSENPENDSQSFDNIVVALLQNVIVISSNNWSQTMYDMIDADYYASCIYFIVGLIIMNFWLANLFVAVITNSFATLTARTKRSAFADQKIEPPQTAEEKESRGRWRMRQVANGFKRVWGFTKYLWILAIIASVGVQASRATYMPPEVLRQRVKIELYFTIAFDVEIVMRFLAFLLDGDWRSFLASKQNRADLFLAVITSIIQIPVIQNSAVYAWLTFFQLARFYRVIAAIPRMRVLLVRAFGSLNKMLNMVLFLLLMVGLAALIAVQLFRGDIPQEDDGEWTEMTFKHIFNSFLAMYQVFTAEDWTTVLFGTISNGVQYKQAVIAAIFISGWFFFANFIVLQMFIAVINENFSVAEGEKRQQQLEQYLRRNDPQPQTFTARLLNKMSPYRYLRTRNAAKAGSAPSDPSQSESGTAARSNKIVGGSTVRSDGRANRAPRPLTIHTVVDTSAATAHRTVETVRKILRLDAPEDAPMPLDNLHSRSLRRSIHADDMLRPGVRQSIFDADPSDQAARLFADERRLVRMRTDLGLPVDREQAHHHLHRAYEPQASSSEARARQAQLIATHPSYEKSYFLFSNTNAFRRFCQSLVPCSYGERMFGRSVSPSRHKIFRIVIFLGIAGSVVSAAIATPAYRKAYYTKFGLIRASWFSILELSLSSLFLAEFFVKTIADGFAFTPNAYVLSVWNALDLFVLVTLLVNVATELAVIGGVSRFTRALKAFRALRLINLSSLMRDTFHAVMIAGAGRILDASILSILYIIPYAVWGQNLFAGLLYSCNDDAGSITGKFSCTGEFANAPGEWTFLVPRVWGNPTDGSIYSFDDFKSSLLILFEIISLEGWIDVMTTAMSVAGRDMQLQNDNRQVNALFFLIYNLVGSTTVLTLFVSVIIENFQTFSGAAYQTAAQRQWIDLKRLIMRQRPSKRPKVRPTNRLRSWCYDRTIHKDGWWSRFMTLCYILNIIVLMTQRYSDPHWVDQLRDIIYLGFTVVYVIDIMIRLLGLGWRSYRENPWNLYDLVVVTGTLATTIPLLDGTVDELVLVQLQKIFLTCVALKLVQKNHALNQLFKTALASLPAILSLFLLWLTMFLVWGIMLVEVFGLTKWGANESYSKNFSTLIGSLVFLSMMSTGEGWNSYMHDYTVSPPQCNPSANYLTTDCGSQEWALVLFIGWNVISMYIFLNMFTGTVVENFSYIFELGGKVRLGREQIRHFKNAWAKFDVSRKGYLHVDQIVPFLGAVNGVLEVKMYPPQLSVQSLTKALESASPLPSPTLPDRSKGAMDYLRSVSPLRSPMKEGRAEGEKSHFMWPASPTGLAPRGPSEAERLNRALSAVSADELRLRRDRFNRIYHEAILRCDPVKGISFNEMLLLLARYKLIDELEALDIGELIERREILEQVEHRVNLDRVRGLLKTVYCRRRYLAMMQAKRAGDEVPTILVYDSPAVRPTLPTLSIPGSTSRQEQASEPVLTVSPAQPSLDDLHLRASPQIASFEATAWGDVMKRVDSSTNSHSHSN
ncbi:hypothetical protein BCV70DRAFT_200837 [Testicularia cyperi]|uniref:Calcium-channel protein CCH1 n=1 Tax=Testicularia cyperi TaxID=1882483 RepID=A0A317XLS3_9BASI|nr:hypothetical protein BCV70DRAFT_200837 [Testicularia cyperi]